MDPYDQLNHIINIALSSVFRANPNATAMFFKMTRFSQKSRTTSFLSNMLTSWSCVYIKKFHTTNALKYIDSAVDNWPNTHFTTDAKSEEFNVHALLCNFRLLLSDFQNNTPYQTEVIWTTWKESRLSIGNISAQWINVNLKSVAFLATHFQNHKEAPVVMTHRYLNLFYLCLKNVIHCPD